MTPSPATPPALANRVRLLREARGLTQLALCEAVQISRQSLSAIEAGRTEPSVTIALSIARVLGVPLEELFSLESERFIEAELYSESNEFAASERVVLTSIHGRWVAQRLSPRESAQRAADGCIAPMQGRALAKQRVQVELFRPESELRDTLVLAGCAPALGLLSERTNQQARDLRVIWLPRAGGSALSELKAQRVHVAGVHFVDEQSGQFNVEEVKASLPGKKLSLITLARWQQGLVVAKGNPLGIRGVEDLARSSVRLLAREEGSGARRLLENHLKRARLPERRILDAARVASGHMDVAQGVALGAADVGVAMEGAALAFGLAFIPLHEERFDLVVPRELIDDVRVQRLLETLASASFRRELAGLGGYDDVQRAGALAAELGGP